MTNVCFEPFVQKGTTDCAIACLSIYLGLPYATVREQVPAKIDLEKAGGLTTMQIRRLATKLGHPLVMQKEFDADDIGILDLDRSKKDGGGHVVLFFKGVIYTTASGFLWTDMAAYAEHHKFKVLGLLVKEERE